MIIIRAAQPGDASAIARVHVDTWRTTYRGILPQTFLDKLSPEKRAEEWAERLNEPQTDKCTWVAETDKGEIVGFAQGGRPFTEQTGDLAEIHALYVLANQQKQGIGLELVRRTVEFFIQNGLNSMQIGVLSNNPSCAFYEKLGGQFLREQSLEIAGVNCVRNLLLLAQP